MSKQYGVCWEDGDRNQLRRDQNRDGCVVISESGGTWIERDIGNLNYRLNSECLGFEQSENMQFCQITIVVVKISHHACPFCLWSPPFSLRTWAPILYLLWSFGLPSWLLPESPPGRAHNLIPQDHRHIIDFQNYSFFFFFQNYSSNPDSYPAL